MTAKFKVLQNRAALENQTETKGGDYTPPAEGQCGLRLVGYIELGKHSGSYEGKPKVNEKVKLIFEISGKKWEPTKLDTGEIVPQRISITMNKSLTSRSGYYKLFMKMRDGRQDIEHMVDMLGEPFLGNIRHDKREADGKVFATLRDADKAFTVRPPVIQIPVMEKDEDEDSATFGEMIPTGEVTERTVKVGDVIGDYKLFLWNEADEEQWASIYIPGEYDGKSKNSIQLEICKAVNFPGSLAEALAAGSGVLDEAAKGVEGAADDGDDDQTGADPDAKSEKTTKPKTDKPKPPKADKKPTEPAADDGEVNLSEID